MALEDLIGEQTVREIAGTSFGINPSSKYSEKEFLVRAEDLFNVNAYHRKIAKNGNDISALSGLAGIAVKYMPGDKGENARLLKDPFTAVKQAKVLLDSGYKNMADYVKRNINSLLKELPEKTLIETAAILPEKGKKYAQIAQYMQVGDIKAARKVYSEVFATEAWKKFILECPNSKLIQHCMSLYVDHKKKQFINKNLSIHVKSGKNRVYVPNPNRAREYVLRTMAGYGAKERNAAYLGLATALYHSKKGIEAEEVTEDSLEELDDVA
jgi:hypothetical protein